MNCRDAYELLLEAEPADLRGAGDTSLTMHLRSCDRCAARAARILGAQANLAAQLSARRPETPADSAVERAAAGAQHRRARRRLLWRAGPALAAATLAGVLAWRNQGADGRSPTDLGEERQPTSAEPPILVQAPPDRDVMIFETTNPNIVVVWLY
jgi:hypothetical protein